MSKRLQGASRLSLPLIASALLAIGATAASASPVTPVSYTFAPGANCGQFCYLDPGFAKLTDGVTGFAGWGINDAAPWVGWRVEAGGIVNIDFNFGAARQIDLVSVGTTQDSLVDVVLPSLKIFSSSDGLFWIQAGALIVPPSTANNRATFTDHSPHVWLDVGALGINAQFVRVQEVSNGPWAFTDEVRFDGAAAGVPEPASWALMIGGFGLAGAALRRRRAVVVA